MIASAIAVVETGDESNAGDSGTAGLVALVLYGIPADSNEFMLGDNGFRGGPHLESDDGAGLA